MTLNLVGLGLEDIEDLTVYGCSVINACKKLYLLESKYHPYNKKKLENYFSSDISIICPEEFQNEVKSIIEGISSENENVALLMPGNPFCEDLYPVIAAHCQKYNILLKTIHNLSYLNAVGNTGIQLYKFGETIFMDGNTQDELKSYLNIIELNMKNHLNTLVMFNLSKSLLPTELLKTIAALNDEDNVLNSSSKIVMLYKHKNNRHFEYGSASDLRDVKQSCIEALAICADVDCVEEEYLQEMRRFRYSVNDDKEKNGNFHVIGLGLGKPEDITLKGQKLIENSDKIFLEGYTSIMLGGKGELESFFKKDIIVADREMVEQMSDEILNHLEKGLNVSFLVVGDPFGATTHADIILRSMNKAKDIVIANNASIINAIGLSGLKPSKFGGIISIPFWNENYKPNSFYDKININSKIGWHTLCLLDIQVKEQSFENLARGRKIYEKPRYMSTSIAAQQILECNSDRIDSSDIVTENTSTISLTRIGTDTESILTYLLGELPKLDLGLPLHSLVIVGKLDDDEKYINKLSNF